MYMNICISRRAPPKRRTACRMLFLLLSTLAKKVHCMSNFAPYSVQLWTGRRTACRLLPPPALEFGTEDVLHVDFCLLLLSNLAQKAHCMSILLPPVFDFGPEGAPHVAFCQLLSSTSARNAHCTSTFATSFDFGPEGTLHIDVC